MKKILTILATAALAASVLASCSRKVDYTEIPFVYFNNASISVSEDAGIIEIPVMALANTEFVVTFETEDGQKKDSNTGQMVPNGENGKDYAIVDNDAAILRFQPGTEQQVIKVAITDMTGVLTGNKDFTVKLTTAGSEVSLGGFSSCKVTIIDNDHPLKAIFGEYMATDGDGLSWTMTFAADPNSYTQVFLDGIVPTFSGNYVGQGLRHYVEAPVTVDPVTGKFSVSIPCGYKLPDPFDGHDIMIFGYDGTYIYGSGYQNFEQTEDGFVMEGDRGFAAIYENGGYYLAASDATVLGPITLKKK